MLKNDVINKAFDLGFEDIGFTTADPFPTQREILLSRKEEYAWTVEKELDLTKGLDPKNIMPDAKSIIILIDVYFKESFPNYLEGYFGRAYLDDDRKTKGQLYQRIKAFRGFLRDNDISSRAPFNIPHRLTAARAGLGTFGKNNFLYSRKAALQSSWITPIPIVVNFEFIPDNPTVEVGCPSWCKNTCIASCPTGALRGPRNIDPRKCISYLSYYGERITPMELREPMGTWIYGCDRCQEVCPRNRIWLSQELPLNQRVVAKEKDFELIKLLHMDREHYKTKIWTHMFYMSDDASYNDLWRWKMNVARAMGNSLDPKYIPELIKAFNENVDETVKGMIAWALGQIGGEESKEFLNISLSNSNGLVKEEILIAIEKLSNSM
ncbi:MAG: epoxyqueuosine reductase [Candidatus Hodarchaeota archaeon]